MTGRVRRHEPGRDKIPQVCRSCKGRGNRVVRRYNKRLGQWENILERCSRCNGQGIRLWPESRTAVRPGPAPATVSGVSWARTAAGT